MSDLQFYEYCEVKTPKYLVIFLHGYGANGENLINLSYEFKAVLPDAHFISPNAIEPWEGGFPHAYQWFSLQGSLELGKTPDLISNIKRANKILQDFISKQLKRFNLTPKELLLVGFSQGAMMAMYQGLIEPSTPTGIVAFSGKLILPEMIGEKIISKPQICLIHGEQDSVVPFSNFLEAQKILQKVDVPFEAHAIPHLDHSIDFAGVRAAQNFIKKIIV